MKIHKPKCAKSGILIVQCLYQTLQMSHCLNYATLNLNEWLTEFETCSVKISILEESIWDIGRSALTTCKTAYTL